MIFLFLCLLFPYSEASSWDNLTAKIAVVEFHPVRDPTLSPNQTILKNTAEYIQITKSIQQPDLVIFPEATLRNSPQTAVEIETNNPCNSNTYPQFVKDLSCAARNSKTYMVVNLIEKSKCHDQSTDQSPNCREFGFYFYNTNVIFNRDGKIIGRYRKYHLFGEKELDKPVSPEVFMLVSDFGIKFGFFTCFDIMFQSPSQELIYNDVDAVIFPSYWYSELPFLTSLQVQQMWAYAHNTTLFGAGGNEPKSSTGGTGIYLGSKGTVVDGFVASGGSKAFLYSTIPSSHQDIDGLAKEMDDFELFTDTSLADFSSFVLDTSKSNFRKEVCHKKQFCCDFSLQMDQKDPTENNNSYTYQLVAFSGVRSFRDVYNGGIELCAVIACLNSSLSSCGLRFPKYDNIQWPVTFEEITIKANFEKSENKSQFPNSLLSSIRPVDARETVWSGKEVEENGKKFVERTFAITKPQNRLLTFAIFGRNFGEDSPPNVGSSNRVIIWMLLGSFLVLTLTHVSSVYVNYG